MPEKVFQTGEQAARFTSRGMTREREFERIHAAVQGIRFGEVRVIIQDGVVIQIDRIEKERLR